MEPICQLTELLVTECAHCLGHTLPVEPQVILDEDLSHPVFADSGPVLVAPMRWGSTFCTLCGDYVGSWEPVRVASEGPVCDRCFP
jgi:hypothetical protein